MEKEATGNNFVITPNKARIFHVTSTHGEDGVWAYHDPILGDDKFINNSRYSVDVPRLMISTEKYLNAVERDGAMERSKMLLMRPTVALVLYSIGIVTVEHFREVRERSSAYFDLPANDWSRGLAIRVAQKPEKDLIVVDERGYPVYES